MSESIRETFRQRERKLNQKFDDERQRLYEVRRERQRQAEDDYSAATQALEAQREQEIQELDSIMEREIRKLQDRA
jgi:hypothetical protein